MDVRSRFKGLGLVNRVPDEPCSEVHYTTHTGDRNQDYPQEKEMQKSKTAVLGSLTKSCEKKRSEKQRRKDKHI